ncbi:MAG: RNA polymerase sigma factor [Dehalococcoidia bacterium]
MDASFLVTHRALARGFSPRLDVAGDDRLARLVGGGSERAFGTIYKRYHQGLYRYCWSIVRQDADAQDVLQSTFSSAFVALRRGQRDAPLRPWLFRIAHNEAISLLRRRGRVGDIADAPDALAPSVEARAEGRARLSVLVADLQGLPERQRGALLMRELSGLSHQEIALALGTSLGGAKQSIFEARSALVELQEGRSMACDDVRRVVSDGDGRALRGRRVRAHLRDCSPCAAFAAAIPDRREELHALAPVLASAAAAELLRRASGGASGHGGGLAALAGAGNPVLAAVSVKSMVVAGVVAASVAGAAGVRAVVNSDGHRPTGPADTHRRQGAAAGRASSGGSAERSAPFATRTGSTAVVPGASPAGTGVSPSASSAAVPGVLGVAGSGAPAIPSSGTRPPASAHPRSAPPTTPGRPASGASEHASGRAQPRNPSVAPPHPEASQERAGNRSEPRAPGSESPPGAGPGVGQTPPTSGREAGGGSTTAGPSSPPAAEPPARAPEQPARAGP